MTDYTQRPQPYPDKRSQHMKKVRLLSPGKSGPNKKPMGPRITVDRMLRAIELAGPDPKRIAKLLGVTYHAVLMRLRYYPNPAGEGWERVYEAYNRASDMLTIDAEKGLRYAVKQREDLGIMLNACKWFLEKRDPARYPQKQIVQLEGGTTPINTTVDITALNLPLDVRKAIFNTYKNSHESMDERVIHVKRII